MKNNRIKENWLKIWRVLRVVLFNKYLLTIVIFLILICFFGEHNLINRLRNKQKIDTLEKEIDFYRGQIQRDKSKINELKSSDDNLEKFAREQYLMKCPNEDVYIVE